MEHCIFYKEFPSREDLLNYATNQAPLRYTTTKMQIDCLNFLVDNYLDFVQKGDLPEYRRKFWISHPQMTRFPEEDFRSSLHIFFSAEHLWSSPYIAAMKHEHLRVLFFIAALRYRDLQEPQQQIKFKEENPFKGGIMDIFLFDKCQSSPTYALQVRLLTPNDLNYQGKIIETARTSAFLGHGIDTFDKYAQDSQITLTFHLYGIDSLSSDDAKTHGCVVLVTPYDFVWINCGSYVENLTSEFYDQNSQSEIQQINDAYTSSNRFSYKREKKYGKPTTKSHSPKLQYSAIPSPSPSQSFNSYSGMNSPAPLQPMPMPMLMYNTYQQPYFDPNFYQFNGGHSNQIFAQNSFLPHLSYGIPSPHPGLTFQPNMIQAMPVMPDPNFLQCYNVALQLQGLLQQQQQQEISAGVRRNPANGWKERGYC